MANKRHLKAQVEHDKFLKRMGCLPEQIKSRKKKGAKALLYDTATAATYFESKSLSDVLQGDTNAGTKRDIISNLYKESPQTQRIIKQRATQVAVLVNKGGYGIIKP